MPLPLPSRSRIRNLPPRRAKSRARMSVCSVPCHLLEAFLTEGCTFTPLQMPLVCQTSCNPCRAYSPCEGTDHTNLVHEILHELFAIFVFQSVCDPIPQLCRLD